MTHRITIPLFLIVSLILPLSSFSELVDRSVAIVNDEIITLSELNELGQPLMQKAASEVPAEDLNEVMAQIRESVLEQLIDKKLLYQEGAKLNVHVSEAEVDNAIQRILTQNNVTMEELQVELDAIGMNEATYRNDLRGQILRSKLVNYEVRSKVIIPEEKIIDYYDLHYTEQVGEGGYYILQIGTLFQDNDDEARKQAKEKIAMVHEKAKQGGDFKKLARQYSELPSAGDGGDLGVFMEKEMAPFMRKAIINLQPGQISEIVTTSSGYQFFTILSRQEGQIITKVPYESVKEEIREKLHQEQLKQRYDEWIQGIREKAYIKIL